MKITAFILLTLAFVSCAQTEQKVDQTTSEQTSDPNIGKEEVTKNALQFINGYIEFSNDENSSYSPLDWVKMNPLATANFKTILEGIYDEAYEVDPEIGLGFDPILDAQDYPGDGFELDSFDAKSNYVIVKGIHMPEFKLTLKLTETDGKWLVDGCGIVNIPENKRQSR